MRTTGRWLRGCLLAAAAGTASCAHSLMTLPTGPGAVADQAPAALAEATAACGAMTTLTAEIGVSGSVGGTRVRGRLLVGLAAPASARLEALAPFGAPFFIFVAHEDEASVLLPRDGLVLEHERPAVLLEAVSGLPLSPAALRTTLAGCGERPDPAGARTVSVGWLRVPDGEDVLYLRRPATGAPWRVAATVHGPGRAGAWRAEYGENAAGLPRSVRLVSEDRRAFDVQLDLSQATRNDTLGPEVFRLVIPPAARTLSLDELRAATPFAAASGTK